MNKKDLRNGMILVTPQNEVFLYLESFPWFDEEDDMVKYFAGVILNRKGEYVTNDDFITEDLRTWHYDFKTGEKVIDLVFDRVYLQTIFEDKKKYKLIMQRQWNFDTTDLLSILINKMQNQEKVRFKGTTYTKEELIEILKTLEL